MCPTVTEELGRELIMEIERSMVKERARLALLTGEESGEDLEADEAAHLQELRELFPEVPLRPLVRILPKTGWTLCSGWALQELGSGSPRGRSSE